MNLTVLYHQNGLLACCKPIGVSAQATVQGDGLPQLLSAQLGREVYPLHRLDQGVGGLMLLCDRSDRVAEYTALLQSGVLRKRYLAVVHGSVEPKQATLHDLLFHDVRKNRTYVVDRMRKGVKEAVLDYTALAQTATGDTLLEVTLHTGRTHQIRAQFAARKLPLCGDGKYGSREKCPIALWAYALDSTDPQRLPLQLRALPPQGTPWNRFADLEKYL